MAYLDDHPPRIRQFKERGTTVSGVIVLHTAESVADVIGPDTGAEGVARFIRDRTTPGSYHRICDSDSIVPLVRLDQQAYGEGTGGNPHEIHVSAAIQAHRWDEMPREWRDATVRNMAKASVEASLYVHSIHGVYVPAKRITPAQARDRAEGFIGHGQLDPGRRTDPDGPNREFPWEQFLDYYDALHRKAVKPPATRGKAVDRALPLVTAAIRATAEARPVVEAAKGKGKREKNLDLAELALEEAEESARKARRALRRIEFLGAGK